MIFGILIFYIGILILLFAAYWQLFAKAGQPGWACMIPVYNILVLTDVARVERKNAWFFIMLYGGGTFINALATINSVGTEFSFYSLIALVFMLAGVYFILKIFKGIATNFGKSSGFAWGLLFLNVIFVPILAFGNAAYRYEGVYKNQDVLDSDF